MTYSSSKYLSKKRCLFLCHIFIKILLILYCPTRQYTGL